MHCFKKVAYGLLTTGLVASAAFAQTLPPKAPVRPVTDDYFGTKVVDNYRWMENLQDPEMQHWMKAQADYTRATLDALPGYSKLLTRIAELNESEPAAVTGLQIVAGRYYSLRTPANAQSPKLYVRAGINWKDRLLIDPENSRSNDKSFFTIHGYWPSPDGRYIAYQRTVGGDGQPVLHVYDVRAGKDLAETADRNFGDPQWRSDNASFFYARGQKADPRTTARLKNERVYLHTLGRPFEDDPPILGGWISDATVAISPDESPEIVTAPGSHYAIARIRQGNDARMRIYAAPVDSIHDGKTAWRPIAPSYDDQYIGGDDVDIPIVALTGDALYRLSRKNSPRGEILKLDLTRADSKPEVVVPQGDLPISTVYAGRDAIFWRVSDAGVNSIHRLRFAHEAQPEMLHLPYAASVLAVFPDPLSDAAVISVSSWIRAPAYLSVNARSVATATTDLQPAGRDDRPDDLVAEEVRVKSWDGTLVPLSIVHRTGTKLDGNNPTILGGYGAYGTTPSPLYPPTRRSWFEHGGIFAVAHVRGGGEYGEAWHQAGFQATKPNTWKDYIACAQYLIDRHYTRPRKLVGTAQSMGGIMIGRAIEERPDLFAVALIRVPAADMLRFETTGTGPHNVPEVGSIKTEAGFKSLYAMSPYAHIEDGVKYPAVILYAGANDHRAEPWLPAKFAARLQAATASGKPVLLRVDFAGGHTGSDATRAQEDQDTADMFAFALWQIGDPDFQPRMP